MNKLTIQNGHVLLNNTEIKYCTEIDIKNISPIDNMDVALHVCVDEVDVKYTPLSKKSEKL